MMEQASVAAATLPLVPATILLLRVKSVVVPLPWFLLWMLAALLVPLCWLVGFVGQPWLDKRISLILRRAHRVVLLLVVMRGMMISVRSRKSGDATDVFLRWI